MKQRETETMGSRTTYWETGEGLGRPIILVHGIRGNHEALVEMAGQLFNRRVILLDLPGHGRSTPMTREHSLQNYEDFLEEFCSQLKLGSFDLWCHSFGANLGLMFAAQTKLPLRRLILVSPAMENTGVSASLLRWFYRTGSHLPRPLGHYLLANPFYAVITGWMLIRTRDQYLRRQVRAGEQRNLAEFRLGVVAPAFVSYFNSSPWSWVPRVTVPTLVIGGREDALVSVTSLAKLSLALPNARLAILDGTGHLAHLEEPARVAALTQGFIA